MGIMEKKMETTVMRFRVLVLGFRPLGFRVGGFRLKGLGL